MNAAVPLTSRDLVSISANPTCQRLIRLQMLGLTDQEGYFLLTGKELPEGRGERTAALRHGKVFDRHLVAERAKALLKSLSALVHFDPETVRILDVEQAARSARLNPLEEALRLTEQELRRAACSGPLADILLQPALPLTRLQWGRTVVRPDALIWIRDERRYWPLEAKGYPAIDRAIEPSERRSMRLQAAVQVLALRDFYERTSPSIPLHAGALLVVSSPFGLTPEPAVWEDLAAEASQIARVIEAVNLESRGLLPDPDPASQAAALRSATWTLQEPCLIGCGMASYCRSQCVNVEATFGESVAQSWPGIGEFLIRGDITPESDPEMFALLTE